MMANPLPAVTILGVCLFGMVRLGYALYYGEFGATPEEAGLGYKETIAQSALVLLILILLLSVTFLAGVVAIGLYIIFVVAGGLVGNKVQQLILSVFGSRSAQDNEWKSMVRRASARGIKRKLANLSFWLESPEAQRMLLKRIVKMNWLVRLMPLSSLFAVVIVIYILTADARQAGTRAKGGHPVHPRSLFGIPFLLRRAETATVYSVGLRTTKQLGISKNDCILYLGSSSDTKLLYDYSETRKQGRTLRVPAASVVVEIPATTTSCGR